MLRLSLPLLAALLAPLPAAASLSGYYDSVEQIETILGSSELADRLGQRPIKSIEFEGNSSEGSRIWEVETEGCDVKVHLLPNRPVASDGQPMVGKTTYSVVRITECD